MNLSNVINQMIELFLIITLGFILFKVKFFNLDFNKKITSLILNVTTPALVLNSVLSSELSLNVGEVIVIFIIAIIFYLALILSGFIIEKILHIKYESEGLYVFMTTFSNVGFMGFAVMKSILPSEAIFIAAIFHMVFNIFAFTIGMSLLNYHQDKKIKMDIRQVLCPCIIASIVAIIIYFLHLDLPIVLDKTIGSLSSLTSPLAMLLIGSSLANVNLKKVFKDYKLIIYSLIRQFVVPIVFYLIMSFIIEDKLIIGVALIITAMPVANYTVLFATQYDLDVDIATVGVFITTLLSLVSVPLLAYLFLI